MTKKDVDPPRTLKSIFENGASKNVDADLLFALKFIFGNGESKNGEPDDTVAPPAQGDTVADEVKEGDRGAMLEGIKRQIPNLLEDVLEEIEVPPLIAKAWSKMKQLQEEYHNENLHPPGERSEVSMAEHTINSTLEPEIEVVINGKRINSLAIDVVVELKIEALILEIKTGGVGVTEARIMAVMPGKFTATGSLMWRKHLLKKLDSSPFELPGRQSLGDGIEIPRPEEAESSRGGAVGLPGQPQDPPNH